MLNATYFGGVSFLTLALMAGTCFAQSAETPKEPPKFYKLDVVVKELDAGKVLNARSYSTTASTDALPAAIRTDSKVSFPASHDSAAVSSANIGVNIDIRSIREVRNELSFVISADITSIAQESSTASTPPVIRQTRWSSTVLVQIKKPTVIFSSDDTSTRREMQVELTATPIP